jgi:hypothetical protein
MSGIDPVFPLWNHHDYAIFRRTCGVFFVTADYSRPQAIWSIRVPCPGGSAASTVGWGALASSAFTAGALGGLASGIMLTGAGAVTQ